MQTYATINVLYNIINYKKQKKINKRIYDIISEVYRTLFLLKISKRTSPARLGFWIHLIMEFFIRNAGRL